MPEDDCDTSAAHIDKTLSESQRLEREEQAAALERQRRADERVVEALSKQHD